MPTRKKSWRTVMGSFAVVLALLVAPACAPLCASRMCSQAMAPAASEERCHSATLVPDDIPQIHAALRCNVQDLAVFAVSTENKIKISKLSRHISAPASNPGAAQKLDSNFIARVNNFSVNPESLRPSDSSAATSVLRI